MKKEKLRKEIRTKFFKDAEELENGIEILCS